MNTHAEKIQENKSESMANEVSNLQGNSEYTFRFVDNRPEEVAQRKLQALVNDSPQTKQLKALRAMMNHKKQSPDSHEHLPVQRVLNITADQAPTGEQYYQDNRAVPGTQFFFRVGVMGPVAPLQGVWRDHGGFIYTYTANSEFLINFDNFGTAYWPNCYWDVESQLVLERQSGALGRAVHIYVANNNPNVQANRYRYDAATARYIVAPHDNARWTDDLGQWVDFRFRVLTDDGLAVRKEYAVAKDAGLNYVLPYKLRTGFMGGLPNLFGGNVDAGETAADTVGREADEESYWRQQVTGVGAALPAPGGTPLGYAFQEATVAPRIGAAIGAAANADVTAAVTSVGVPLATIPNVVAAILPFVSSSAGAMQHGGLLSYQQFKINVVAAATGAGATPNQARALGEMIAKPETQGTFTFRAHEFSEAIVKTADGIPLIVGTPAPDPAARANAKEQIKDRILELFTARTGINTGTDLFYSTPVNGETPLDQFYASHSIDVLVSKIIVDNRQYNQGKEGAAPVGGESVEYRSGYTDEYTRGLNGAKVPGAPVVVPPNNKLAYNASYTEYYQGLTAARVPGAAAVVPGGNTAAYGAGYTEYYQGLAAAQVPGAAAVVPGGNTAAYGAGYTEYYQGLAAAQVSGAPAVVPGGNTAAYGAGYTEYYQGLTAARIPGAAAVVPGGNTNAYAAGYAKYYQGLAAAQVLGAAAVVPLGNTAAYGVGYNAGVPVTESASKKMRVAL
jgi:hypothetical protein